MGGAVKSPVVQVQARDTFEESLAEIEASVGAAGNSEGVDEELLDMENEVSNSAISLFRSHARVFPVV